MKRHHVIAVGLGMFLSGLFGGPIVWKHIYEKDAVRAALSAAQTVENNNEIETIRIVRTAESEESQRFERRAIETSHGVYVDGKKMGEQFVQISAKAFGAIAKVADMLAKATPTTADVASLCDAACRVRVQLARAKAERDPLYRNARTKRNTFSRTVKGYHNYRAAAQKFMVAQAKVMGLEKELRSLTRHPRTARPTTMAAKRPVSRLQRLTLRIVDIHDDATVEPSVGTEANLQLSALRTLAANPADAKPATVTEPKMTDAQRKATNLGICALRAQAIWEKSAVAMDNEASGAPGGHIAHSVVMHAVVDEVYYCDVESSDLNLGIGYPLYHAKDLKVLYECQVTPTRSCGNRKDWKGFPFYSLSLSDRELRGDDDDDTDIRPPELVRGK